MVSLPPSRVYATLKTYFVEDASQGWKEPILLMSVFVKYKVPWAVTILNAKFNLDKFPVINNIPYNLKTVWGFSKFCMGNPDYFSMAKQWHQKRYTICTAIIVSSFASVKIHIALHVLGSSG